MNEKDDKENVGIKYQKNYSKFFLVFSILNLIASLFTICFIIVFDLLPNSFQGNNIDEYSNDYCKNKDNDYYEILCTNRYYKYNIKKSKFIWIITDGTASDQLNLLSNYEKYKIASPFLVETDDIAYRQTNEMHTALITGKHNRNVQGKEIKTDNIIQQIVDAGYKVNFRGWKEPIPDIVGDIKNGIKENKIFNKKFIDDDHEVLAFSSFCNITNPFPFLRIPKDKIQNPTPNNVIDDDLLKKIKDILNKKSGHLYDKISKLELYEELDELFEENPIDLFNVNIDDCLKKSFDWNENENISILYYTTEVDHFNHYFGKTHINTVLQMYITEKMIERIMEWIDNHDDYALIIFSDHGGQEFYGEDALRNHGEELPGNEAILIIYTKELKEHFDELKMRERYLHMIDDNEIISQILLNINIPINSRGFPKKLFNSDINAFISLKMKEIQLIQLMEKYIQKYKNYENSLKNILNELKSNFSLIGSIINEYITNDFDVNSYKAKEFKNLIETYEKSLSSKQIKIYEILDNKKKDTTNIILFVFIFIAIFFKFLFEINFLFFKILDKESAEINNRKKKYFYIINVAIFILFQIFWLYCSIFGINLREGIIMYCFFYGYYIAIVLFHYIFNYMRLNWTKNKTIIIALIGSIFCFTVFCQIINYSTCFYYLKRNFSYFVKVYKIIINFFGFYIFLFFLIIKKINEFREKKYFISFCKKKLKLDIIPILSLFFLLTIFIEDSTKKEYYDQNMANRVFVCINFILFIILWILSHFVVYKEKNEELLTVSINNNIVNNEGQNNFKYSNNYDFKSVDNMINNKKEMNDSKIREINFINNRKVEGLPCIKIFLILAYIWISDEGQKLFGLIILYPILEILDYLSNHFYSKLNNIIYNEKNNDLDETKPDEVENSNSINESLKTDKKIKRKLNYYLLYFLFYIIIQDVFLVINLSSFALIKNSFGFESDKNQISKTIYVLSFLKVIISNVEKYRYIFFIVGYFLEKGIYDNKNKNEYSMIFLVRKILVGIRIDLDIIFFFYQMLININDKIYVECIVYYFVNTGFLLIDYLGYGFTKLGKRICV